MRIHTIAIDEDNVEHLCRHGVTESEIRAVLMNQPSFRRNRRAGAADFYAVGNGVRVNFRYTGAVARPISAWRVSG